MAAKLLVVFTMNFLISALSETDGRASSVRLLAVISGLAVLAVWCINSYQTKTMAPVSFEQLGLALGPLGFKVLQKGKETPAAPAAPVA